MTWLKWLSEELMSKLGALSLGHVVRIDGLTSDEAHQVCAFLRQSLDGDTEVAVVSADVEHETEITVDGAIERRNDKSRPYVFFVPVELEAEAAASLADTERVNVTELFRSVADKAERRLPKDIRGLVHEACLRVDPSRRLDLLAALGDAPSPSDVGANLWRVGLIPDNAPTEDSIKRNRKCVRELMAPSKSSQTVLQQLIDLGLAENEHARKLASQIEKYGAADEKWLQHLAEDGNEALRFDTWSFEDQEADIKDLQVLPFTKANGKPYSWSGLSSSDDTLTASVINASKPVTVRWTTNPATPATLPTYIVTLEVSGGESETLLEEQVKHRVSRAKYQIWRFDPTAFEDTIEGSLRVRIRVRLLSGGNENEPLESYSEEFLLVAEEAEPEGASTFPQARSIADFKLERALRRRTLPTIERLAVDDNGDVRVTLVGNERRRIPTLPLLCNIQRRAVKDTQIWGRFYAVVTEGDELRPEEIKALPRPEGGWVWETKREFLRRRGRVLSRLGEPPAQGLVEAACLAELKVEILEYARTYANLLQDMLAEGEEDPNNAELRRNIEALLTIDTIDVWSAERTGAPSRQLGMVILPTHPLRLLWHLAHEELLRVWTEALCAKTKSRAGAHLSTENALMLDGSNFPMYLSPHEGVMLSYAGNMGFYWPVLVRVDDEEPHESLRLIQSAFGDHGATSGPTNNDVGADVLARKLNDYLDLHPYVRNLQLNCVRPGDGRQIVEALAQVETSRVQSGTDDDSDDNTDSFSDDDADSFSYEVRLYSSRQHNRGTRTYFDECASRRQKGEIASRDVRKLFEPHHDLLRPHLFWAVSDIQELLDGSGYEAHVSLVNQLFTATPKVVAAAQLPETVVPFSAYGLCCQPHIKPDDTEQSGLRWLRYVQFSETQHITEHPADSAFTVTILRLMARGLALSAAVFAGDLAAQKMPVSETVLGEEERRLVDALHSRSDWVVTMDRDLCIEVFDSPQGADDVLREQAKRYLIDFSPEYLYGGGHHLMVSTQWVDEVAELLRDAMREMLIVPSDLACFEVLELLKSLSGRLAMHLVKDPSTTKEAVGLAVTREVLRGQGELEEAFLIPADSHPELFQTDAREPDTAVPRPDLLRVVIPAKNARALKIEFIEVKYRRQRWSAEDTGLWGDILTNLHTAERAFRTIHFPQNAELKLDLPLTRHALSRLLHFYADRAVRHGLLEEARVDQLTRWLETHIESSDTELEIRHRAYIYSPELPFEMETHQFTTLRVTLLGSDALPRYTTSLRANPSVSTPAATFNEANVSSAEPAVKEPSPSPPEAPHSEEVTVEEGAPTRQQDMEPRETPSPGILVGHDVRTGEEVFFTPAIKGNPHLLIVGIPGMGKTTAVINICRELARRTIYPFVIDFHGDIATALHADCGPRQALVLDAASGLQFNPLELDTQRREKPKGWREQVYDIAEIFGDIFPDFGQIQREQIREYLTRAYRDAGFTDEPSHDRPAPSPKAFWHHLDMGAKEEKAVRKITARLGSIFEFHLFSSDTTETHLLDELLAQPCVLDVSKVAPDENKLVAASFFLNRIYRGMFARTDISELRNALVFDEAHRVAKLRLIPKTMQECRKYGIAFIVSSQRLDDFREGVVDNAGATMSLRVNHPDAKRLAQHLAPEQNSKSMIAKLQKLKKYRALFTAEEYDQPREIQLVSPS